MEIYVFVCTNNFSPFYFLCTTNMPHHFPTMDSKHINYVEPFKTKISMPFIISLHETLHSYNNLFPLSEGVFKGHKHSFIY